MVLGDPELLAGFDDPLVMAAVAAIAADPQCATEYQNDAKVGMTKCEAQALLFVCRNPELL